MVTASSQFQAYITKNATGVAADLRAGKTLFGPSGLVTGTAKVAPISSYRPILLNVSFPLGEAGAYNPYSNRDDFLVIDSAVTLEAASSTLSLDANGFLYASSGASQGVINVTAMPAKTMTGRRYRAWGKFANTLASTGVGIVFDFNRLNDSNFWRTYLSWHTSGYWEFYLAQYISGGWNFRASGANLTLPDSPCIWSIETVDFGDTVAGTCLLFETDTTVDATGTSFVYNTASRTNKTVEKSLLSFAGTLGTDASIGGMEISDT